MAFVNRCIFLPTSGGTGTWTVSTAVQGYLTPAQAGATDASVYRYTAEIRDGGGVVTAWEVGTGTYTVAGTTLTRTPILSSNANALVNFVTPPQVMLCILAEDLYTPVTSGVTTLGSAGSSFFELYIAPSGTIYFDAGTAGTVYIYHNAPQSITIDGPTAITLLFSVGGVSTGALYADASQVIFGATDNILLKAITNNIARITISAAGSVSVGTAAIATNATDGFLHIPTCAGTPTGTPTLTTGLVPMIFDTTNSQFWFYTGGAWKQPKTPAGAAIVTWQ